MATPIPSAANTTKSTSIADALNQLLRAELNGNGKNGSTMGLKGWLGQVANLTAVALVCLMFYQLQESQLQQAREDRHMFREELKVLHDDAQRYGEAIRANQRVLEEMAEAVKDLAEQVHKVKTELHREGPHEQDN